MYFTQECWAKILSPGQARPAPPTLATTLMVSLSRGKKKTLQDSDLEGHIVCPLVGLTSIPYSFSLLHTGDKTSDGGK